MDTEQRSMPQRLKDIIESLLFVSETPLTMEQLKGILDGEDTASIRAAVEALMAEFEQRDGGFVLKQVAGGYQFRTQGRYNEWIKRLIRPNAPRLSKAALETLAIIAYNQPIIRSDIEHIRGVDSGGVLRMLMERKLIRVLGRKEIPGRPLIYATTKHFLEVFELKDLKDLPTPREIEELSRSRLEEQPDMEAPPGAGEPPEAGKPPEAEAPDVEDPSDAASAASDDISHP
ncbi:segregation and condensation protein B [Desulfosarcina alkanivorans]|uniref:Segregation and condensation protein B n=1 Tax=Desulfosarcina alkanivorans TaxID=571177 RepID=A0A5K7YEN3_9BACT|nr:SMC-Scp complex subunit ScpB [Desulfosarcina alkanivorans]BBO66470.1 segregation and condensation protein B [Desulfosarcina alkanivorans]